jgi:hypothetical protein
MVQLPKPLKVISDWVQGIQAAIWLWLILGGIFASAVGALSSAPLRDLILLFFAGILIVMAVAVLAQDLRRPISPNKQADETTSLIPVQSEFVSVRDAAIELYRELPNQFLLARATERLRSVGDSTTDDSPEDMLNRVAKYIASKIPVYGKKSPASVPSRLM